MKPSAKQSRLEIVVFETRYFFPPFSSSIASKKLLANASSLICAPASGVEASNDETVWVPRRRDSGMILDSLDLDLASSSVSISRASRPRYSVLFLASFRRCGGVRYGRGND